MKDNHGWPDHMAMAATMLLLGNGALVQLAYVHHQFWSYLLLITTPLLLLIAIKRKKHVKHNKYEDTKFRADIERR